MRHPNSTAGERGMAPKGQSAEPPPWSVFPPRGCTKKRHRGLQTQPGEHSMALQEQRARLMGAQVIFFEKYRSKAKKNCGQNLGGGQSQKYMLVSVGRESAQRMEVFSEQHNNY